MTEKSNTEDNHTKKYTHAHSKIEKDVGSEVPLEWFLADRCNATFGYYHSMSFVVCLSSVMRVYCDKTAEARIMQFH